MLHGLPHGGGRLTPKYEAQAVSLGSARPVTAA